MNTITNQWQFVAPLTKARSSIISCVLEGKLFVFGGYNGFATCKSTECYHHQSNRWEKTSFLLPNELSGSALAVISDLPQALHYTYYGQCAMSSFCMANGDGICLLNECYNCKHNNTSVIATTTSTVIPVKPDFARKPKRIAQLLVKYAIKIQKLALTKK